MMQQPILSVKDLSASFFTAAGEVKAVRRVSFEVGQGRIIGIVGESGSGKSMTARCVMRLIKYPGRITGGSVQLMGRELTTLDEREMSRVRGGDMSMIFQEPMTSLNPVMKVGKQVREAAVLHRGMSGAAARAEAVAMLERVGISEPERRYNCYPHELSGGLRQRVMIAMAMISNPRLLIADEPTTALDVTVEAQILDLMQRLRQQSGMGIILISHNLGVVARLCDEVHVMYAGRIVESADVFELFSNPLHPYTRGLLGAVTSLRGQDEELRSIPGTVPDLRLLGEGCGFMQRCPDSREECGEFDDALRDVGGGHLVRCCAAGV